MRKGWRKVGLAESVTVIVSGFCVFAGAVVALLRGIFRQTESVRENTKATQDLTEKMQAMEKMVHEHEIWIRIEKSKRRRYNVGRED